jgi:CMP-N-acetylneuraminic acid synthetase
MEMYKNHKVLCIIPARGGSKGLPKKNILDLAGKPLVAHTIKQAKGSKYIDRTVVSSEDPLILEIARRFGAEIPFIRPSQLATDEAGTIDVLLHAIDWFERNEKYDFDILVLLHATTPLRNAKDIDNCIQLLVDKAASNVFSVTKAHRNPYFNMVEIRHTKVALVKRGNFLTRQSAPDVFDMNSSIYVWWKDILKRDKSCFLNETQVYCMPKERSIDVDDMIDFKIAEALMKESKEHVEER